TDDHQRRSWGHGAGRWWPGHGPNNTGGWGMFQSRGAILAIAVTAIASVLLVAGMGISRTQGAGTDIAYPDLSGGVSITLPDNTGTPPQSPSEPPPAVPSNPTGNPAGTTDATTPGTNPENTGGQAG